jgi:hypothetical protein
MKRLLLHLALIVAASVLLLFQSPVLTKSTVLTKTTKMGAVNIPGTWAYLQNPSSWAPSVIVANQCTSAATSCTLGILPTTAGGIGVAGIISSNNITITSCSYSPSGNSFTLCSSGGCHTPNNVSGQNEDGVYYVNEVANDTSITCNFSAGITFPGNGSGLQFYEMLPPVGTTASLDGVATTSVSTCTSCTLAAPTITGIDGVIHLIQTNNPLVGYTPPYFLDFLGNPYGINVISSTPNTITQVGGGNFLDSALAFKSSVGLGLTVNPPIIWSQVNALSASFTTNLYQNQTCNPTCSVPIQSTGSGNLFFVETISNTSSTSFISSVTGGGTWVIPSGSNTCQIGQATIGAISCAYVLSDTSGVSSLNVTMSGTSTVNFATYEISKSGGAISLDTQNSTYRSSAIANPSGQVLTLSGRNDVCMQAIQETGVGSAFPVAVSLYPLPGAYSSAYSGGAGMFGLLMNTNSGNPPVWQSASSINTVSGICFK